MITGTLNTQLVAGIDALHIELDWIQQEKLLAYIALLAKWNKTYSLTAIREPAQMLTHHVLDSLALVPFLFGKHPHRVLDVGSGFGAPGIPLAIAYPGWQWVLLDSNQKKTAFLHQACLELGLSNIEVVSQRVEHYQGPVFDIITCRAFATLVQFVKLTQPLLAKAGEWIAMKGTYPQQEIALLPDGITVKGIDILIVPGLSAKRHLVHLTQTVETPKQNSLI